MLSGMLGSQIRDTLKGVTGMAVKLGLEPTSYEAILTEEAHAAALRAYPGAAFETELWFRGGPVSCFDLGGPEVSLNREGMNTVRANFSGDMGSIVFTHFDDDFDEVTKKVATSNGFRDRFVEAFAAHWSDRDPGSEMRILTTKPWYRMPNTLFSDAEERDFRDHKIAQTALYIAARMAEPGTPVTIVHDARHVEGRMVEMQQSTQEILGETVVQHWLVVEDGRLRYTVGGQDLLSVAMPEAPEAAPAPGR